MIKFKKVKNGTNVIKLGIYFPIGSIDETGTFEKYGGISHVLEHNIFKGTMLPTEKIVPASLSSVDIPLICRFFGAEFNAFTMKTCTCYYFKFFKSFLKDFCQLLDYLVKNASFLSDSAAREMKPIVSELAMRESVERYVFDLHALEVLDGPPSFFKPVIGTKEFLSKIAMAGKTGESNKALKDYFEKKYLKSNYTVLCVGDVDDEVENTVKSVFSNDGKIKKKITGIKPKESISQSGVNILKDKRVVHPKLLMTILLTKSSGDIYFLTEILNDDTFFFQKALQNHIHFLSGCAYFEKYPDKVHLLRVCLDVKNAKDVSKDALCKAALDLFKFDAEEQDLKTRSGVFDEDYKRNMNDSVDFAFDQLVSKLRKHGDFSMRNKRRVPLAKKFFKYLKKQTFTYRCTILVEGQERNGIDNTDYQAPTIYDDKKINVSPNRLELYKVPKDIDKEALEICNKMFPLVQRGLLLLYSTISSVCKAKTLQGLQSRVALQALLESGFDAEQTPRGGIFVHDARKKPTDYDVRNVIETMGTEVAERLSFQMIQSFEASLTDQSCVFHREIQELTMNYKIDKDVYRVDNIDPSNFVNDKQIVLFDDKEKVSGNRFEQPKLPDRKSNLHSMSPNVDRILAKSQTSEVVAGCYSISIIKPTLENYVNCRLVSFILFGSLGSAMYKARIEKGSFYAASGAVCMKDNGYHYFCAKIDSRKGNDKPEYVIKLIKEKVKEFYVTEKSVVAAVRNVLFSLNAVKAHEDYEMRKVRGFGAKDAAKNIASRCSKLDKMIENIKIFISKLNIESWNQVIVKGSN